MITNYRVHYGGYSEGTIIFVEPVKRRYRLSPPPAHSHFPSEAQADEDPPRRTPGVRLGQRWREYARRR